MANSSEEQRLLKRQQRETQYQLERNHLKMQLEDLKAQKAQKAKKDSGGFCTIM